MTWKWSRASAGTVWTDDSRPNHTVLYIVLYNSVQSYESNFWNYCFMCLDSLCSTIWFPSPAPVPREGHGTQGTFIKFYTGWSSSFIQTRKVIISHPCHHSPGWRNGKLRPSKSCLYHHSDSLPTAMYKANDLNYILRTLNWYTFSKQSSCIMLDRLKTCDLFFSVSSTPKYISHKGRP